MAKTGKKVLIVGGSAGEYTLAKKLVELEEVSDVYVAPGNDAMKSFCKIIDIKENRVNELLEFVLENAIDLTVVSSETAIKEDIVSLFQANGQMIFGPTLDSASVCISKTAGKKFMYKNRISCPKFGVFDKPSMALDYVKNSKMPIVVKSDGHQEKKEIMVCNSFATAKAFIEELFDSGEKKIIIEDFIEGHEFSFYVVTDGYHALPLGSVATYKHEFDGADGLITDGMGAFSPDYKISSQIEQRILNQIVYPTLNNLERMQTPYVGILGVDLIMSEDEKLFALEFNSFLQNPDCQVILTLLNENLLNLIEACVVGSFADDYDQIDLSNNYVASCVISSKKDGILIQGLDGLDDITQIAHFNTKKNKSSKYETTGGRALVLTRTARVLTRAVDDLYDEISVINFEGMQYRNDIGKMYQ